MVSSSGSLGFSFYILKHVTDTNTPYRQVHCTPTQSPAASKQLREIHTILHLIRRNSIKYQRLPLQITSLPSVKEMTENPHGQKGNIGITCRIHNSYKSLENIT